MPGILSGLRVLDLSQGIAGPMAAMLLADHGADVVKIEPPGGDPFRNIGRCRLGYRTWQRGKRSAIFDLKDETDYEDFLALADHADILVEGFCAETAARLGVDHATLIARNPRLIHATIDGYGDSSHAARPAYDLLATARLGMHWEHVGWPEGSVYHTAGWPDPFADFDVPQAWRQGPAREGPVVLGVPTLSIGAAYSAMTAISAALLARESNGRGQHVRTSLLHGAAAAASSAWQRAERADAPDFSTWVMNSKSPKGHFQCADGRWIHNWVANPRFILGVSQGDSIDLHSDLSVQDDPNRFGTAPEEVFVVAHYQPIMAAAVVKYPASDWVRAAAAADITLQEARSPEAALADPAFLADGCVRQIDDPLHGMIRQLGTLINFEKTPAVPGGPAPYPGQDDAAVRAEARQMAARPRQTAPEAPATAEVPATGAPLAGIRVLDLGMAIAGPFGAQVLGDLGADVIKVSAFHDSYWHRNHLSFTCNRSKRSLCVNLKDPDGLAVFHDLVRTADVVQHNMRAEAARRLGIDYETLKAIRPDLIYCHSRGHDRGGRDLLPGNEQTAGCLAGVQYEDGAVARGGKPLWALTTFGDTGTGFLTAIGVIQALYHRARSGEGQAIDTAIVNAQLLACSHVIGRPDGSGFDRPRLDAMQLGFSALYGLYQAADGWLALAVLTPRHWQALVAALPELSTPEFATAALRADNDAALRDALSAILRHRGALHWYDHFDATGVSCEISDPTVSARVQDDPEMNALGLVAHFDHPLVGRLDQAGPSYNLSQTPVRIRRRPIVLGEGTAEILREIGYDDTRIAALSANRTVGIWREGDPLIEGPRRMIGGVAKIAAKHRA